jgi:glycosyltransferase involved in cell wall biosynthesis
MNNNVTRVPIVSIITPSYNQGKFLGETIESVISQEGNFLLDYIIVDGGSTDNSVDIIKQYDALLKKVEWPIACRGINFRWMSEKDKGQTEALMKGFRIAEGEIFAWLNSDDTYLPGALHAAAAFFRDQPDTALLYGDSHYCDAAGTIIGRYQTENFDLNKIAYFNFICQPSSFFRKDAFEAVGGLDETLHFAMDYDLWIKIGKRFSCRYLPRFFSTYRLHETSKTIRDETLFNNIEEQLRVAIKHFNWAPLNRVYRSRDLYCRAHLPTFLKNSRFVVICTALICAVFYSLSLNRGIRRKDLKLLNRANFRKFFKSRFDIMTGN